MIISNTKVLLQSSAANQIKRVTGAIQNGVPNNPQSFCISSNLPDTPKSATKNKHKCQVTNHVFKQTKTKKLQSILHVGICVGKENKMAFVKHL